MTIRDMLEKIGTMHSPIFVHEFAELTGTDEAWIRSTFHLNSDPLRIRIGRYRISNVRLLKPGYGKRTYGKAVIGIIPSEWLEIITNHYTKHKVPFDQEIRNKKQETKTKEILKKEEAVIMVKDFRLLAGRINHNSGTVRVAPKDIGAFIDISISDLLVTLQRYGIEYKIIKETSEPCEDVANIGFLKKRNKHATTAEL